MIKNAPNHVIVSVDMEKKNHHTFADGTVIRLERQWNNLNRRETEPVNATVIAADGIPEGAEIIIHHNATHPTYELHNFKGLNGEAIAEGVRYFSIREDDCFIYREQGAEEWKPCKNFLLALRVFKPYEGPIVGIEPTLIKNRLYITHGQYAGNVVSVLTASDYEMIFQGTDGREQRIIRCRHFGDNADLDKVRQEVTGIDKSSTKLLNLGKLLVGLSPTDAKTLPNARQR